MLTFPADKSDFSAPNGVTYAWDGTDGKWRVKAFRSIDDFIVQLQDQAPAADESKVGDLWFDTSDESLTLFVYTGGEWVPAAPPVSLDGINATIDAALIVQSDLLARVESGEIVQTGVLDSLTTLQHKVEALEGTVIDGKWYAESRSNPREGGFDITSGGLQSMGDWNADFLRVHKTDSTGKAFTFAEVSTGDYIRIGAPGSTAVYKINEVVSGSLDWQAFGVELANSTGTPIPDLTYDFEFLPSFDPSAYATVQYVDAQDDLDVKKTGDTMTGNLSFTGGDRIITVNDGNRLRVGARDSSDNGRTFIDIQTASSNGAEGTDAGYRLKLYHLATPTAPFHAVNMQYVDDQVDGLASEEYVDNAVAGINIPDAGVQETDRIIPKPSRWTYKKDETSAETLQRGEFFFNAAKDRLYMAHYNEFGYRWFPRKAEYRYSLSGNSVVTITDYDGAVRFMARISHINFNVGGSSSDSNYCRLDVSDMQMEMEPFNNSRYLINIPGLQPSWRYEPFSAYGTPT